MLEISVKSNTSKTLRNNKSSLIKQQDSVKNNNKRRKIDYVKHFLLPGMKSIRITKLKTRWISPFSIFPCSDLGTDNYTNTSLSISISCTNNICICILRSFHVQLKNGLLDNLTAIG